MRRRMLPPASLLAPAAAAARTPPRSPLSVCRALLRRQAVAVLCSAARRSRLRCWRSASVVAFGRPPHTAAPSSFTGTPLVSAGPAFSVILAPPACPPSNAARQGDLTQRMSTAVEGSGLQPTAEREAQIRLALEDVRRRMEIALAGRASPKLVRLVAVGKTKPASDIVAAYNCGQRHFGENYVNELVEKSKLLPSDIQWHYIGALQTNKFKFLAAIPNLFVVETVDGAKKADALNNACDANRRTLNVFIQVNTSGEESKNGINPSDAVTLAKHIVEHCPRLNLQGLMTIGARDRDENGLNPDFLELENCKTALHQELGLEVELSMGMSADFEHALNQGSTNVRIGSTIFGERDYSKK